MIDTEGTGHFNACVDGGRLRADLSVSSSLLLYAQGIYAFTKSEQPNGLCDARGRTSSTRWPSVFTDGFEYTTQAGQPLLYFNGAVLYRFTSGSNLRLFVGQQRGAFRCASGVCRYFPPFEGARAELTLRF